MNHQDPAIPLDRMQKELVALRGETTALSFAILALLRTHPNPAKVKACFDLLSEQFFATQIGSPIPDSRIDAFQNAAKSIAVLFQNAVDQYDQSP